MPTAKLLRTIALAVCGGNVDANLRPLLTTRALFDDKAPRTIALGPRAVGQFGWALLAVGIAAVIVVTLFYSDALWLALPAAVALAFVPRPWLRQMITNWLDRLAALD